jgi:hypothetical protein
VIRRQGVADAQGEPVRRSVDLGDRDLGFGARNWGIADFRMRIAE